MTQKIGERLNGDLTDPLNLNIIIYICTYLLSAISSLLPCVELLGTEEFGKTFFQALTDCIVPTTATLVLGSIIQNLVIISQNQIRRFALSIWSLMAVIVYTLTYSILRAKKFLFVKYNYMGCVSGNFSIKYVCNSASRKRATKTIKKFKWITCGACE